MDAKYILRVMKGASFEKMKGAIDKVHEKTGKNKIATFFDMLLCAKKYGAGYYDYQVFGFANLNAKQRETYMTRVTSRNLNMFMNNPEYTHFFDNKDEFNTLFAKYIRRDWLNLEKAGKEDVAKFAEGKETFFAKPRDGECGHGVEKIRTADFESIDALYDYLKGGKFFILEEQIRQHEALERMHPGSVNCMRIITLIDDGGVPHCIYVTQKLGKGDLYIDNNTLFSPVDPETGKIKYPAHSGDTTLGIVYTEHPDTHIPIQGYQIPYVKEAVAMCLEAAMVVPQVRYVGWDVAVAEDGPMFVEGNTFCAHDFWQLPPHTPDKTGMMPTILKYVPSFHK